MVVVVLLWVHTNTPPASHSLFSYHITAEPRKTTWLNVKCHNRSLQPFFLPGGTISGFRSHTSGRGFRRWHNSRERVTMWCCRDASAKSFWAASVTAIVFPKALISSTLVEYLANAIHYQSGADDTTARQETVWRLLFFCVFWFIFSLEGGLVTFHCRQWTQACVSQSEPSCVSLWHFIPAHCFAGFLFLERLHLLLLQSHNLLICEKKSIYN